MRLGCLLAIFALPACGPNPVAHVSMNQTRASTAAPKAAPVPINSFGLVPASKSTRDNKQIARDFLDLSFRLESGQTLPVLTRFEGPITLRMAGAVPPRAATDLARLLTRLRHEAGINIREVAAGPASINIEFVPRKAIQTTYDNVACLVVPRVASWAEFRAARGNGSLNWTRLRERKIVSVFIPADSPAQEVRDCLHEEVAQAIGPLNDLFRLTDSVFNDDNFHTVLTGFDMTILRAYYAPELTSGMSQAAVAAHLPGILARINPGGNRPAMAPMAPAATTPRVWIRAVQTALGTGGSAARRMGAARLALSIARAQGWTDGRLAFSHFVFARQTLGTDPDAAIIAFNTARRIYRRLPGAAIHVAHIDVQLAAVALARGQTDRALGIANRTMPAGVAAENASLLATLMMVKAEALQMQGKTAQAQAVRMDSAGWARYGFGPEQQIRKRLAEIAAMALRDNKS
jgi:predicted nucleic acid-binding protein